MDIRQLEAPNRELVLFATDSNAFALGMHEQLRRLTGNLFFSPFSIRTALAMTYAGARGDTAVQMRDALHLPPSEENPHLTFAKMILLFNAAGGDECEMAVANSLWGQDGASFETGFLDLVNQHYGGGMNRVDFRRSAEAARLRINEWVEDRTNRKILGLVPLGGVDADTRLVLANAVYFKGTWVLQFDKANTRVEPFYLEGGRTVQAPLMYQQAGVRYMRADGYQAVELPYRGGALSMLVILPDRKDGLGALESKLSPRMIEDCIDHTDFREVELFLPRFKLTWEADLRDPLAALGMSLAFDRSRANFSGINGHEPPHEDALFISRVFHKAFVEVNEKGTEAAAATVETFATLGLSEPRPTLIFRADHPFLFALCGRGTGTILFLGRVADPARES